MNHSTLLSKISGAILETYPFPFFMLKDLLAPQETHSIIAELRLLEKTDPTSIFNSEFGQKREWKSFPNELEKLNDLLMFLGSASFIDTLKVKFEIAPEVEVFPDFSYDGGGYVISPPGSFLGYHADFNFSSSANMYRVLNVLLYLNENYASSNGGELHLLDSESKTVEKRVSPEMGTLLGFFTDDTPFHGVSRNNEDFFRRSLNLYYYSASPISQNQKKEPHKTIWIDTHSHNH